MGMRLDHFMDSLRKGEVDKGGALYGKVYVRKEWNYPFPADGAPRQCDLYSLYRLAEGKCYRIEIFLGEFSPDIQLCLAHGQPS